MYTNAVNLLERATFLHPYPCTREETIKPTLPEIKGVGVQWDNMRMAMKWTHYSQFFVETKMPRKDIAHFWVTEAHEAKHVTHWPTPVDPDDGFVITEAHPRFADISGWATGAVELDEWLTGGKAYLSRVLKAMKHPQWVEQYWPQIVPYVGKVPEVLVKGMREPRPTALHLDMVLQDEIQNKLTLASLLPKDKVLNAWVGRYPT
jgi:hypothetical protein